MVRRAHDQRYVVLNNNLSKVVKKKSLVCIVTKINVCKNKHVKPKESFTSTFVLLVGLPAPRYQYC